MKRSNKFNTILAGVLTVVLGLGAVGCYSPDEGYEAVDPGELPAKIAGFDYEKAGMEKYAEPITITVGAIDWPLESGVKEGTMPDNQSFNEIVKQVLNINLEYTVVATSANYGSRLNLAVTGNREPDMFYTTDPLLFSSLKNQGRLADLGPSFWYLNQELQDIYLNVIPDVLKNVMVEGALYSFPVSTNTYESAQRLYIRKDWLDICGIEAPQSLTMDGLIEIGEKFVANAKSIAEETGMKGNAEQVAKQLIPLAFHNDIMGISTASASAIMQACGASPDAYFLGDDGELYASNTSDEMKTALTVMADMYKKGIIDKQFTTKNVDMVYNDISSGKVGMVFGQWWLPNGKINETVSNANLKAADWISVELPSYNGKEALPVVKRVNLTGYNCVSSKCKYPEAAAKIINLFYDIYYSDNHEEKYGKELAELMKPEAGFYHNMVPIKVWNTVSSVEEYKRVNAVFKQAYDEQGIRITYDKDNKLTSDSWRVLTDEEIGGLTAEAKTKYEAQLAVYNKLKTREKDLHWKYGYPYYCEVRKGTAIKDMPSEAKKGWGIYNCMIADNCGYAQVTRLTELSEAEAPRRYDEFYGTALSMMEEYSGYLSQTLSTEVFMKIITGKEENIASAFDRYVSDYAKNGGDKIIRQVNLWYKAQPSRKPSEG